MKNLTFVMLANMFIKVAFTVCVTVAAIHFNSAWILCWYLLLCAIGHEYKEYK